MQLPAILQGDSLTRLLQGAAAGAAATIAIGFIWGGWVTGGTAKDMERKSANSAVIAVLAPICADKFRQANDATMKMTELKKVSSWQQDTFIADGGWATFAGKTSPEPGVAQACANLLTTLQ